MLKVALYLAILGVLIATIWMFYSPDFEPAFGIILALSTSAVTYSKIKSNERISQDCIQEIQNSLVTPNIPERNSIQDSSLAESLDRLADRFLLVFESHGIHLNEIPRVIPIEFGINLSDLINKERLLSKLSPFVINWICDSFNISRKWIETQEGYIYETSDYYKHEINLLNLIKELKYKENRDLKLIAFKSTSKLDYQNDANQLINLLLAIPTLHLDERTIYKFYPTRTLWNWGHWRSRFQIKGILRACLFELNVSFEGYDLNENFMFELSTGKIIPEVFLTQSSKPFTWYPSDYCQRLEESNAAKETGEIEQVAEFIRKRNYLSGISNQD